MKTGTKSSVRNTGMKIDSEKSDSGQNETSSKPGTSQGSKPGIS